MHELRCKVFLLVQRPAVNSQVPGRKGTGFLRAQDLPDLPSDEEEAPEQTGARRLICQVSIQQLPHFWIYDKS